MSFQLLQSLPHPIIALAIAGVMTWLGIANLRESWRVTMQYLDSEEASL